VTATISTGRRVCGEKRNADEGLRRGERFDSHVATVLCAELTGDLALEQDEKLVIDIALAANERLSVVVADAVWHALELRSQARR
jgi:hypothetical protein